MSDIRDWGAFIRGRWDWSRHGYEKGFPRGCQFTDVDAAIEFDGRHLVIESKHYDGIGDWPPIATGQMIFLRQEAALGKAVLILYGCGPCNDPYGVVWVAEEVSGDDFQDWRCYEKPVRRELLKQQIDKAMGIARHKVEGAA